MASNKFKKLESALMQDQNMNYNKIQSNKSVQTKALAYHPTTHHPPF